MACCGTAERSLELGYQDCRKQWLTRGVLRATHVAEPEPGTQESDSPTRGRPCLDCQAAGSSRAGPGGPEGLSLSERSETWRATSPLREEEEDYIPSQWMLQHLPCCGTGISCHQPSAEDAVEMPALELWSSRAGSHHPCASEATARMHAPPS